MQSPATSSSTVPHTIEESIELRTEERTRLLTRTGWDAFIANVPLPALWVTAHVDFSLSRTSNDALEQLKMDLKTCQSKDAIANAYRTFLQKILTRLNRKILKSRNPTTTFRFLGSLERNSLDLGGRDLHYHFFLWDPTDRSIEDSLGLKRTAETLRSLWLTKVNNKVTERYKPIEIQVVLNRKNAVRVAEYTNKTNPLVTSYELFDDWATSR
jgi:hypothetical protein